MKYKQKEVIGDCILYLGDCMEVMPLLGKVDAVVTDPPYGIKRDGHAPSAKKSGGKWCNAYEFKGWDNCAPSKEIFDTILSLSDTQIIWGGNYFSESLPSKRGWLVWYKGQQGLSMSDAELAWTNIDAPLRLADIHRTHLWQDKPEHPTQKPLKLMKWCMEQLPKETVTILDPFMGSGTTGVACAKMGRKFIGIELDEAYFDIACERIKNAYMQPSMFIEKEIKLTQEKLF